MRSVLGRLVVFTSTLLLAACSGSSGGTGGEGATPCSGAGCPCDLLNPCDEGFSCAMGICLGDGSGSDAGEEDAGADATTDAGTDAEDAGAGDADAMEDIAEDAADTMDGSGDAGDAGTDVTADGGDMDGGDMDGGDATDADAADSGADALDTGAEDAAEDTTADAGDGVPFEPVVIEELEEPLIAFERQPDIASLAQVFVLDGPRTLQVFTSAEYLSTFAPTFSPDGTEIAYVAFTLEATRVLGIFNLETGERTDFTLDGLVQIDNLAWAPSGDWIALEGTRADDADAEIYLFDRRTSTTAVRQLTSNDYADVFPRWTNDGRLFYVSTGGGSNLEIFSINPFASEPTPRAEVVDSRNRGRIAVSPDGASVYYSQQVSDNVTRLVREDLRTGLVTELLRAAPRATLTSHATGSS